MSDPRRFGFQALLYHVGPGREEQISVRAVDKMMSRTSPNHFSFPAKSHNSYTACSRARFGQGLAPTHKNRNTHLKRSLMRKPGGQQQSYQSSIFVWNHDHKQEEAHCCVRHCAGLSPPAGWGVVGGRCPHAKDSCFDARCHVGMCFSIPPRYAHT